MANNNNNNRPINTNISYTTSGGSFGIFEPYNFTVKKTITSNCSVVFKDFKTPSESYKQGNLIAFCIYLAFVIITILWMKTRQNAPLLRKSGDFLLKFISSFGGVLLWARILRESWPRNDFPCLGMLWIGDFGMSLLVAPIIVRLIRFRNKAMFYKQMNKTALAVYVASRDRDQKNLRHLRLAVSEPSTFLIALQALNMPSLLQYVPGARLSIGKNNNNNNNKGIKVPDSAPSSPKSQSPDGIGMGGSKNLAQSNFQSFEDDESASKRTSLGLSKEQKKQAMRGRASLAAVSVESVDSGYFTSQAFAILILGVLLLPILILVIAEMIVNPIFRDFSCVGCRLPFLHEIIYAILGFFVFIACGIIWYKVSDAPDPFRILLELAILLSTCAIVGGIGWILYLVDPNGIDSSGSATWTYMYCVVALTCHVVQIVGPTFRTYKRAPGSNPQEGLQILLSDATGLTLFQEHMTAEFNVESLRYYLEAKKWHDSYDSTDANVVARRAYEIYRTFIERGSFLECNLSDELRRQIESKMAMRPIPKDLFDESRNEVFSIMITDSYPRFIKSKFYQQWTSTTRVRRPSKTNNIPRRPSKDNSGEPAQARKNSKEGAAIINGSTNSTKPSGVKTPTSTAAGGGRSGSKESATQLVVLDGRMDDTTPSNSRRGSPIPLFPGISNSSSSSSSPTQGLQTMPSFTIPKGTNVNNNKQYAGSTQATIVATSSPIKEKNYSTLTVKESTSLIKNSDASTPVKEANFERDSLNRQRTASTSDSLTDMI